nr:hypothetical protein [uncultured Halomonas sp.]
MPGSVLTCRRSGQSYPYQIHRGLNPAHLLQLHEQWEAEKVKILREIIEATPQVAEDSELFQEQIHVYRLADLGWRWLDKALAFNTPEYHWFFLEADEKIQAVCIIYHPKASRLDGDRIFYVDYVASAYWNRNRPGHAKQFGSVGRILIAHASYFAITTLGYRPGFCLHSLPTAESYYKNLGMIEYGADATKENLRYYEAPQTVADQLAREALRG